MNSKLSSNDNGYCIHREAHGNQKIQYICLQNSCLLNRLLCRRCVNESHRKHKVGIIDKLIEPLNRLNMNSCYSNSQEDYNYLNDRLKAICEEWEKLNEIFYNNMKELQTGILFQLNTVMKTFSNEEVDKAYEVLMQGQPDIQTVNEYVSMINFLNRDYLQDVEAVKKFADYIADRVKRTISKTVKKVDILLKKMQDHIKQLDFTKYREFKEHPEEQLHDGSQNRSMQKVVDKIQDHKVKREDEETTQTKTKSESLKKMREQQHEQVTNRYAFSSTVAPKKSGFQRYK